MIGRVWGRSFAATIAIVCAAAAFGQKLSPQEIKEAQKWLNMYGTGGGGDWCSLTIAEVQNELGLSPSQKAEVEKMTEAYRVGAVAALQKDTRRQESEKLKLEFLKRTEQFLGAKWERYQQLNLQMLGPSAVVQTKVQQQLGLNAAQVKKIKDVASAHRAELWKSYVVMSGPWNGIVETLTPPQRSFDRDLNAVLTAKQRDALKKLGGKPFAIPPSAAIWRAMREIQMW